MTPKPKVRRVPGDWPAWQWTCCEVESKAWAGWVYAQMEADRHSRTHTAERIADQLDRNALARRVDSIAAIDAAHRETDYSVHQQGVAMGLERASRLVREHLAGRAS